MIPEEECLSLSPHVARRQPGYVELAWNDPSMVDRVRALAWTCDCKATFYELLQVGGQAFIRRTIQAESGWKINETFRWRVGRAREMWECLLRGQAR